ncbi:MAG: porin family protein [Acidobacteria bacterium]|nr:porin family protein [Acidobacteriota bacterium]
MSFRLRFIPVVLAAVTLVPVVAAAQYAPATFGFKVGVNSSTLSLNDTPIPAVSPIWGAVGGAFIGKNMSENFGLQLEALVSQRGAKEDASPSVGTIRTNYLDVPLTARFGSTSSNGTHFHVFTGPQFGILLQAEVTDEPLDVTRDIKDDLKSWDLGWTLGAGVEMNRLSLDARYTLGLTNINKFESDGELKNRTFTFLLGYRFQ